MNYENPEVPTRLGEVPPNAPEQTKRVAEFVGTLLNRLWETMHEFDCAYDEFDAAKEWLLQVGKAGEWPLFMDVFVEHVVEKLAAAKTDAGQSSIQGPFYQPNSPELPWNGTVPMRADEKGEPLIVRGRVLSSDGTPLPGAVIDHWQADSEGFYSTFGSDAPDENLRGRFVTNDKGEFEIHCIKPAPYMIPHDGPTGQLLEAGGWHPWRPAHLHYFVDAEGHDRLTTQLFFVGDEWLGSDVAGADKPDLTLDPQPNADGVLEVQYDFVLAKGGAKRLGHSATKGEMTSVL